MKVPLYDFLDYSLILYDLLRVELERAYNFRASGIDGLWIPGLGRARVSQIRSQARRALEAI